MHAAVIRIDERPFDVQPECFGAASDDPPPVSRQAVQNELARRAHNRRTERGHAVLRQGTCHEIQRRLRIGGRGEVRTTRAIDLQVDESRRDPAILNRDIARPRPFRRLDADDAPVGHLDPRGWQLAAVAERAPPQHWM